MTFTMLVKTWRDHWKSVIAWAVVIVGIVAIQLSVYPSIAQTGVDMDQFINAFPEAFKGIFRIDEYTTGSGYLNTEVFSLIVPLVFIGVGAAWGASATAQEVERGSAEILFTLPVSRWRILASKMLAAICVLAVLALITYLTIWLGAGPVDMRLDASNLAAATISCALLGAAFSGLGYIVSAFSSKNGVALGVTAGVALLFFVFYSLDPMVDTFDAVTPVNPFQWALGEKPLSNGFDLTQLAKLSGLTLVLYCIALVVFSRKDIPSK